MGLFTRSGHLLLCRVQHMWSIMICVGCDHVAGYLISTEIKMVIEMVA